MKKKLFPTLTALACALTCSLGLAACGGDNDANAVTADKWSECFTALGTADNLTVETGTNALKLDGAKYGVKMNGNEAIFAKDGENYSRYLKEGATADWTKEEITEQDYTSNLAPYKAVISGYSSFKDDFNSFTYADGKYTCASIDKTEKIGGVIKDVTVIFDNNKLKSLAYTADTDTQGATYTLKDIGATSITLPAVSGNQGGAETTTYEVTAEEWTAAFNVTSFTIEKFYTGDVNHGLIHIYEIDGNKFHFDITEHQILSVEGDKGYVYTDMKENGVSTGWERAEFDLEEVVSFLAMYENILLCVKDSYSDFSYTEGKYTAGELNIFIDEEGLKIVSAEITFENKKLTSVKLTTESAIYTVSKFDATTITLPANYTESGN